METDLGVTLFKHRWVNNRWERNIDVCSVVTPTRLAWVARDVLIAAGYLPTPYENEPDHSAPMSEHTAGTLWTVADIDYRFLRWNVPARGLDLQTWIHKQSEQIESVGLPLWASLSAPAYVATDPTTGLPIATPSRFTVAEAAEILSRDPAIETGQRRLFDFMLQAGWTIRQGENHRPTDWTIRFELLDTVRRRVNGVDEPYPQVLITVNGVRRLHELMGGEEPLDLHRPAKPSANQPYLENQ